MAARNFDLNLPPLHEDVELTALNDPCLGMNISSSSSLRSIDLNQDYIPFPLTHHHHHHHHHQEASHQNQHHYEVSQNSELNDSTSVATPSSPSHENSQIGNVNTSLGLGFRQEEPWYDGFFPSSHYSSVRAYLRFEELESRMTTRMEEDIDPNNDSLIISDEIIFVEGDFDSEIQTVDLESNQGEIQDDIFISDLQELVQIESFQVVFGEDNPNNPNISRPAASTFIRNLPSIGLTKEYFQRNNVCAVCTDEFNLMEKVTSLPCSHYFHGNCILPWLNMQNTCPLCRCEFATDDLMS